MAKFKYGGYQEDIVAERMVKMGLDPEKYPPSEALWYMENNGLRMSEVSYAKMDKEIKHTVEAMDEIQKMKDEGTF